MFAIYRSCSYVIAAGINMNVHNMLGNVLVNYFILRSFEFPGNIIGIICCAYLGRRFNCIISMLLAAFCVFFASFCVTSKLILLHILPKMHLIFISKTINVSFVSTNTFSKNYGQRNYGGRKSA